MCLPEARSGRGAWGGSGGQPWRGFGVGCGAPSGSCAVQKRSRSKERSPPSSRSRRERWLVTSYSASEASKPRCEKMRGMLREHRRPKRYDGAEKSSHAAAVTARQSTARWRRDISTTCRRARSIALSMHSKPGVGSSSATSRLSSSLSASEPQRWARGDRCCLSSSCSPSRPTLVNSPPEREAAARRLGAPRWRRVFGVLISERVNASLSRGLCVFARFLE